MKKIKYLLLIAIICFFVMPSVIRAAQGFIRWSYIVLRTTGIEPYYITDNVLENGVNYMFTAISHGGAFCQKEFEFQINNNVFELVDFYSQHKFKYDNDKIKYDGEMDNNGCAIVTANGDFTELWRIELKVKEDAKCGLVEVGGYKYNIKCENNSTQEENSNNDDNNKENNENDNVILNDTKFYILAGLLGTVVIEIFVLILNKTKK